MTAAHLERGNLRRRKRHRLHYPAWIVLRGDQQPHRCTLYDISECGAKIALAGYLEPPEQFKLLLSEDGRMQRLCRIVWRVDNFLGVEFLRPASVRDRDLTYRPYFP